MSTQGTAGPGAGSPAHNLPPWLTRRRLKIAICVVCLTLVAIVVWQNWVVADAHFLFMTIQMPRSLLMILTLLVGFILGLTVRFSRRNRKRA
jgi:uncharacterized integral membrane protein